MSTPPWGQQWCFPPFLQKTIQNKTTTITLASFMVLKYESVNKCYVFWNKVSVKVHPSVCLCWSLNHLIHTASGTHEVQLIVSCSQPTLISPRLASDDMCHSFFICKCARVNLCLGCVKCINRQWARRFMQKICMPAFFMESTQLRMRPSEDYYRNKHWSVVSAPVCVCNKD